MANEYGWIDFYTELADKLLPYKDSRPELIRKIRQVYVNVGIKLPKLESDNNPKDIDPFTVFGLFNKGISNANRIAIIKGIASEFGVTAAIPDAFDGIPVLNNLKATFYWFQEDRAEHDIDNLWSLFSVALDYAKDESDENQQAFVRAYVKNKEVQLQGQDHKVSGMLLYAGTDEELQPDNSYQMSGNKISVRTLDLNQEFPEIAKQLDNIAVEHFGGDV